MKYLKSRTFAIGTIASLLLLLLASNAYAIGEQGSYCGNVPGCLNFTMYPGSVKTLPWILINSNNYSLNFYIDAPYYGNSSTVPHVDYGVNCSDGQSTNVIVNGTTQQELNTCIVPAYSNFTVPITVNVSKKVPLNETWGSCKTCLSIAYVIQTSNSGGATIALPTAKRILINVMPKPIPTTTIRTIIQPTCSGTCNVNNTNNTNKKLNTTNTTSNSTKTLATNKDPTQTTFNYYIYILGIMGGAAIIGVSLAIVKYKKKNNKKDGKDE